MRQTIVIENDKGQQYNVETNRIYTSDTLPTRNITEGSVYVDNATKEVKIYIGTRWQKIQVGKGNIEELLKGKADADHTHTEYATNDKVDLIKQNLEDGKVDKAAGKSLSSNDFTDALLSKLNGIEDGAERSKVTSVAGKTGSVYLHKSDVGLSSVENLTPKEILEKMSSTDILTALGYEPERSHQKDRALGYAGLDSKGKIKLSALPDIAKQSMFIVENTIELSGLKDMAKGDRAYVTNDGDSFIYDGESWLVLARADWENVNLEWNNIVGKPTSNTALIDDAVAKRHTHSNQAALDQISSSLLLTISNHIGDTQKHLTVEDVDALINDWSSNVYSKIDDINIKLNAFALKEHTHSEYVDMYEYRAYTKQTDQSIRDLQREAQESNGVVFMDEYVPVEDRSEGVCYLNIL